MTAPHIVDPASVLTEALTDASPDLMRNLLQTMINAFLPITPEFNGWGETTNGRRFDDLRPFELIS